MNKLILLENDWLRVQISPEVGGAIFSCKYNLNGQWIDIMRPTSPEAVREKTPGEFSSFNMIPYSNRIEHGTLLHGAYAYQLAINDKDGHAIHGEVRDQVLHVVEQSKEHVVLGFASTDYPDISWPYQFSTQITYRICEQDFIIELNVKNDSHHEMPVGAGIHPYFVRDVSGEPEQVMVEIPVTGIYPGDTPIPSGSWEEVPAELDFSQMRELTKAFIDRCYRCAPEPIVVQWMESKLQMVITSDPVFEHVILYCPKKEKDDRFFAIEPVTNCNNGFNMANQGIKDTGTVYLEPQGTLAGTINIKLKQL